GNLRYAESDQHIHFTLDALRSRGERLQQREPLPEMGDRFHMGGPLDGAVTSFVPVGDRLSRQSCLHTVMSEELWLGRSGLRKLRFQYLCNPLVVVLPRAF